LLKTFDTDFLLNLALHVKRSFCLTENTVCVRYKYDVKAVCELIGVYCENTKRNTKIHCVGKMQSFLQLVYMSLPLVFKWLNKGEVRVPDCIAYKERFDVSA
jgi:hypothetical protein